MSKGKSKERQTESSRKAEEELKRSTELKSQVESSVEELKASFTKAKDEVKAKENEIDTEIAKANEDVASMHSTAKSSVSAIEAKVKEVNTDVDSAYTTFENLGTIIPVATLIVYYVAYFAVHGFVYDVTIFGGLAITLPLALVLRVILNQMHRRLQTSKLEALNHVREARQGLGAFIVKKLNVEPGLKKINEGFSKASRYSETLLTGVRDYVPSLETYYKSRERINRQETFRKTLRNALTTYGFIIDQKAEEFLDLFGPLTESEDEWLEDSAKGLSPIIGVSPKLLILAYSDYVGDLQKLKNVWSEISASDRLVAEISKVLIANEVVDTTYIDKGLTSYGAVEKIIRAASPFTLDVFKRDYSVFNGEYSKEKRAMIDGLRQYQIELSPELEEKVKKFVPVTFDENVRKRALFEFAAKELGLSVEIVQISYFEREAETQKRIQTWEILKAKEKNLASLVSLLVENRLVEVPSAYEDDREGTNQFVARALSPLNDFTVSRARSATRREFGGLDIQKTTFLRALHASKIILSETDREEFQKWIPSDLTIGTMSGWLQKRLGIPSSVLLLFYYDYVQDVRLRKQQFASIDAKLQSELARVLIEQGIIPAPQTQQGDTESVISNLKLLLAQSDDYERSELQSSFSIYNQLLNYSEGILEFLKGQALIGNSVQLEFGCLVKEVRITQTSTLQQLQSIISGLIKRHALQGFDVAGWHEPVTLATLTMYLVIREDVLQLDACKQAGASERATRILYQFSRVNDEEEQKGSKEKTKFRDVVKNTIEETYTNYDYFEPFRKELSSGFLFQRISHLLYARLHAIDEKISDKKKLEEKIKTFSSAMDTFLQSKLQAGVILETLRMQLVAAYMVTNPSAADVITGIIDSNLRNACKELAKMDPTFKDFLLLSEDTFGRGTRVGIVPFGMDFDNFSRHFEKAFHLAVKQYVSSGAQHPPESYSGNVIRIFPADAYFRRIEVTPPTPGVISPNHPVQIIRSLVLQYYGPIENLELIASLQGDADKTVAMQSLLHTFFDTASTIYLMGESQLKGILAASKFLDYIREGKLDNDLVSSFRCATRSQLALTIFQSAGQDGRNALMVKQNLNNEVSRIVKQTGARPEPKEIAALVDVIFQVLFDIGMVLRGFSAGS